MQSFQVGKPDNGKAQATPAQHECCVKSRAGYPDKAADRRALCGCRRAARCLLIAVQYATCMIA